MRGRLPRGPGRGKGNCGAGPTFFLPPRALFCYLLGRGICGLIPPLSPNTVAGLHREWPVFAFRDPLHRKRPRIRCADGAHDPGNQVAAGGAGVCGLPSPGLERVVLESRKFPGAVGVFLPPAEGRARPAARGARRPVRPGRPAAGAKIFHSLIQLFAEGTSWQTKRAQLPKP